MQNWTCPTSEEWQRYLLDPEDTDRGELERHLEVCPQCRFTVARLRRELDVLRAAWVESATPDAIRLFPVECKRRSKSVPCGEVKGAV